MESVQVEILGQVYSIKAAADREYIKRLAAFVDARMKDVQKGAGTADISRVAILAALNISDELHRLKSRFSHLEQTAHGAVQRLWEITDQTPENENSGGE